MNRDRYDMRAKQWDSGIVYKNSGASHLTLGSVDGKPEGHVTTVLGGLKQGGEISFRDYFDGDGNPSGSEFVFKRAE